MFSPTLHFILDLVAVYRMYWVTTPKQRETLNNVFVGEIKLITLGIWWNHVEDIRGPLQASIPLNALFDKTTRVILSYTVHDDTAVRVCHRRDVLELFELRSVFKW